jgi:DNA-binding LacI/PurR family transcriptional regulator
MSITIKDIARMAGVSHTTVSRALRGHPGISPATTARIQGIASEQGYLASAAARSLKTSRSQAVGVILSYIDDPFFSEVLEGIEDILQPRGYSLFVAASHHDNWREKAIVRAMLERRVDGVIICSPPFRPEHSRPFQEYGLPLTVINNQDAEDYQFSIYHDDADGSRQVARYLLGLVTARLLTWAIPWPGAATRTACQATRPKCRRLACPLQKGLSSRVRMAARKAAMPAPDIFYACLTRRLPSCASTT